MTEGTTLISSTRRKNQDWFCRSDGFLLRLCNQAAHQSHQNTDRLHPPSPEC